MAPTVGRIVHYYDREEIVNAHNEKRAAAPYPAIVTRVHQDQDGQPLDVVGLAVFDPEVGQQIKRDVRPGDPDKAPEANCWYWPPRDGAPAPPVAASADDSGDEETTAAVSSGGSRKKK
jgi:hypothetical protein